MIKRLDMNNPDDRLTLGVFKSLFALKSFEIRGRAFVWRRTHDRLIEHYGHPARFGGLWSETSSADGQNPRRQA